MYDFIKQNFAWIPWAQNNITNGLNDLLNNIAFWNHFLICVNWWLPVCQWVSFIFVLMTFCNFTTKKKKTKKETVNCTSVNVLWALWTW